MFIMADVSSTPTNHPFAGGNLTKDPRTIIEEFAKTSVIPKWEVPKSPWVPVAHPRIEAVTAEVDG